MPWMHPDSPDDYLRLLRDIDRDRVGVHLDFANMINGFDRYANRMGFIAECFDKLGPYVKSIHAKDVRLGDEMPCCLRECPPGQGDIDFAPVLRLCEALGPDTPVFVEHIERMDVCVAALDALRAAADRAGVTLRR